MSLLDRGPEPVTVYPAVVAVDWEGNTLVRAGTTPVRVRATVQPIAASRDDMDATGYRTDQMYRLRFPRGVDVPGMAEGARVVWRGSTYSVVGPPLIYSGSSRTAHTDWTIRKT